MAMIILAPEHRARNEPPVVVLFGEGLLGGAISRALRSLLPELRAVDKRKIAWESDAARRRQLASINHLFHQWFRSGGQGPPCSGLELVWAAGKSGFAATEAEAKVEYRAFEDVLALAEELSRRLPGVGTTVHLISSAGALFEGQRLVGPDSRPEPRRPYGRLKMKQEQRLQGSKARIESRIYRLSSVYGYVTATGRRGLIPTLIANGIQGRVTRITGRPESLRDFICADDVGAFVAGRIADRRACAPSASWLLASCTPCSIHEVQTTIEEVQGHRSYVTYSAAGGNAASITFSRSACPRSLRTGDLRTNITKIHDRALCSTLPGGYGHG